MRTISYLAAVSLLVSVAWAGSAEAQPDPADPGAAPAAPRSSSSSSSSSSSGGGQSGIGLGAEATLTGLAGATFIYDAGPWRIDVVAGMEDQDRGDDPEFFLAGRFFWVIHRGERSDFSLGGGVGLLTNDRDTDIHIEGGAQVRVFLSDNVALNGSFGLGLVAGDNDRTGVGGQLLGAAGIAYYFY